MKKNPIKTFLDESKEWHALLLGIWRAWMPMDLAKLPPYLYGDIMDEYHYHLGGYWFMRIIQILAFILALIF